MKIKFDFVTNSSSASYIIVAKASFTIDGKTEVVTKRNQDVINLDMVKMIEGALQTNPILKTMSNESIEIHYTQTVDEIFGDGWDGGDYQFSGGGYVCFGRSDILEEIMTKDEKLIFTDERLSFPEEWISEFEEDAIREKYNISEDGY